MGPYPQHRADMAGGIQEPHGISQSRRDLQTAGALERKTRARIERRDAPNDAAEPREIVTGRRGRQRRWVLATTRVLMFAGSRVFAPEGSPMATRFRPAPLA